jgi:hypothetical protein
MRISRREFVLRTTGVATLVLSQRRLLAAIPPVDSAENVSRRAWEIKVDASHPAHSFDPDQALGSSMDILPYGTVDKVYTEPVIKECLSAGWGPITYRQNTELQIAAWHWNRHGTWSDPARQSGYFTGSSEPFEFLRHSYGYPLPRRGNTRNGGTEHGYSRLTDGNPSSYWKSNPYLSSRFTGEGDALHPQWVVIDLGAVEQISVLRIAWEEPFARRYEVQYWTGEHAMDKPTEGKWAAFLQGTVENGQGGEVTLKLSASSVAARFLRIWMTESSGTCSTNSSEDPRNRAGYAIREVYAGNLNDDGEFVDLVQHRPDQGQTATYCSSIDPWHSASDLDEHAGDQTGFDLFFTSGITNHLPAMIPIAMLYGTPEDSAAQVAYLKKRGYPISYVEMGEEPDGQYMLPEDYGALYLQWATALHRVDASLKLGGPVFQGVNEDIKVWPDAQGRTSWLGRFVDYLKAHGRIADLAFMSFEHYPLPPCDVTWSDLYREPQLVSHILQVWRDDGLPEDVPLMNTESNVSWQLTQPFTEIFAALWLADSVGAFLTAGGAAYYHSPIQPEPLRSGCHGWTTYGNFVADESLNIRAHTSQYFASRLINREWVKHGAGVHRIFPAGCDLKDAAGHVLITAYAVQRPDREWSLLLVNRDQSNAHPVVPVFHDQNGHPMHLGGPVRMASFGSEQYTWHSDGPNSRPDPDGPPSSTTVDADAHTVFTLPKASVMVLRGKMG